MLWLLEPSEAAATSQQLSRIPAAQSVLAEKARLVWLLDANTPVAPMLGCWEWKKAALKAPVESTGGSLTRLEQQGLDRLIRALRGYSLGIALAGGAMHQEIGREVFRINCAQTALALRFDTRVAGSG